MFRVEFFPFTVYGSDYERESRLNFFYFIPERPFKITLKMLTKDNPKDIITVTKIMYGDKDTGKRTYTIYGRLGGPGPYATRGIVAKVGPWKRLSNG